MTDKRARRHYGVEANGTLSKFPSGKRRAYVDNIDGYERVPGCLFWYVKKVGSSSLPVTRSSPALTSTPR